MRWLLGLISEHARTRILKEVQESYNLRLASDLDLARVQARSPVHARLGDWIDLAQGSRVLEDGCGPGRYVGLLARLGFDVVGVDPNQFDTWANLQHMPNINLRSGILAENLPFVDESFDHVCCLGALLYFSNPQRALSEMFRVLRPGGRLVLRTINRDNAYTRTTGRRLDPTSKNLFGRADLIEVVQDAGFLVHEYFDFGFFPSFGAGHYWYLQNVLLSEKIQITLNKRNAPGQGINHIIHATRPD